MVDIEKLVDKPMNCPQDENVSKSMLDRLLTHPLLLVAVATNLLLAIPSLMLGPGGVLLLIMCQLGSLNWFIYFWHVPDPTRYFAASITFAFALFWILRFTFPDQLGRSVVFNIFGGVLIVLWYLSGFFYICLLA